MDYSKYLLNELKEQHPKGLAKYLHRCGIKSIKEMSLISGVSAATLHNRFSNPQKHRELCTLIAGVKAIMAKDQEINW